LEVTFTHRVASFRASHSRVVSDRRSLSSLVTALISI
jgi:hypothetical protein